MTNGVDIPRLRQDAHGVLSSRAHELEPAQVAYVVGALLHILDDPSLITPEGWFMARKPDLLNKGINDRRDMT